MGSNPEDIGLLASNAGEPDRFANVSLTSTNADTFTPLPETLTPGNNATNVQIDDDLIIVFDEAIQQGSGTIRVKNNSTNELVEAIDITSNQVTVSQQTLTVNLSVDLEYEETYHVEIDGTAIADLAGNLYVGISSPAIWNFTTAKVSSPIIPIASSNPNDAEPSDAGDIAIEPTVAVIAEPPDDITTEPTGDIATEPTSDISTEPNDAAIAEPTGDTSTEPNDAAIAEPTSDISTEPNDAAIAELTGNISTEPNVEVSAEPTGDTSTESNADVDPASNSATDPSVNVVAAADVDMAATPLVETMAEPHDSLEQDIIAADNHLMITAGESSSDDSTMPPVLDIRSLDATAKEASKDVPSPTVGSPQRQIGTSGEDRLIGTRSKDILRGGQGNDVLIAGKRNDGDGRDELYGGAGNDFLKGGNGQDVLLGGNGRDRLKGGKNQDELLGGNGHDVLIGGQGHDALIGGNGKDKIRGGKGQDTIIFNTLREGEDTVFGFELAKDRLDLSAIFTTGSYSRQGTVELFETYVSLAQRGSSTQVNIAVNAIATEFIPIAQLKGVQADDLSVQHFILE